MSVQARRRRMGVQPREKYLAEHSASRDRPWLALGMSRRSYYRKGSSKTLQLDDAGNFSTDIKLVATFSNERRN